MAGGDEQPALGLHKEVLWLGGGRGASRPGPGQGGEAGPAGRPAAQPPPRQGGGGASGGGKAVRFVARPHSDDGLPHGIPLGGAVQSEVLAREGRREERAPGSVGLAGEVPRGAAQTPREVGALRVHGGNCPRGCHDFSRPVSRRPTRTALASGELRPITVRTFGYVVVKYAALANVEDVSPHDLRHRFGHEMAKRTPLHRLAQIIGHDSLDTTMVYVRGTQGGLQRAVEKKAWT